MQDIRCGQCDRKLAEIAGSFELQIKRPPSDA
ncbi:Com family DNA-binding transcriptional regulator [Pseudomonas sp. R4-39-08]